MASEICTVKDPSARGVLIEKFIEIAKVGILLIHVDVLSGVIFGAYCAYTCIRGEVLPFFLMARFTLLHIVMETPYVHM